MQKIEHPQLVYVVWEDATTRDSDAWSYDHDHSYEPKMFAQVGFLLLDEPQGIVLTSAWSEGVVATRDQIPRGMIRHIEVLTPTLGKRKPRPRVKAQDAAQPKLPSVDLAAP